MISIDELAKITPVRPPIVNKKINPIAHSMGESKLTCDPVEVAIHLKILIPVGIAMIIVAAVKYARVSISIPMVNMWCAHTIKPRNPIALIA
jgi:hypothetical protein